MRNLVHCLRTPALALDSQLSCYQHCHEITMHPCFIGRTANPPRLSPGAAFICPSRGADWAAYRDDFGGQNQGFADGASGQRQGLRMLTIPCSTGVPPESRSLSTLRGIGPANRHRLTSLLPGLFIGAVGSGSFRLRKSFSLPFPARELVDNRTWIHLPIGRTAPTTLGAPRTVRSIFRILRDVDSRHQPAHPWPAPAYKRAQSQTTQGPEI